jgi:hypothetical protein
MLGFPDGKLAPGLAYRARDVDDALLDAMNGCSVTAAETEGEKGESDSKNQTFGTRANVNDPYTWFLGFQI